MKAIGCLFKFVLCALIALVLASMFLLVVYATFLSPNYVENDVGQRYTISLGDRVTREVNRGKRYVVSLNAAEKKVVSQNGAPGKIYDARQDIFERTGINTFAEDSYGGASCVNKKYIFVHHSVPSDPHNTDPWSAIHYDWDRMDYTEFILPDGTAWIANSPSAETYHAYYDDLNCFGYAFSLPGNYSVIEMTAPQLEQLISRITKMAREYGISSDQIMGHGEHPKHNTECPGLNVDMEFIRAEVGRRLQGTQVAQTSIAREIELSPNWVQVNTSSNESPKYKIIVLPKKKTYLIRIKDKVARAIKGSYSVPSDAWSIGFYQFDPTIHELARQGKYLGYNNYQQDENGFYVIPPITDKNITRLQLAHVATLVAHNWGIHEGIWLSLLYQESKIRQWHQNGSVVLSYSGTAIEERGIGLTQITPKWNEHVDIQRAINDAVYNLNSGAEDLIEKNKQYNDNNGIPNDPNSWYIAIRYYMNNYAQPAKTVDVVYGIFERHEPVDGQILW